MAKFDAALDHVKIAAPCAADWDQMFSFEGERVRFCSQCNLNVYNLSAMTQNEAATLIYRTEGRLCVRFYRRPDGTILTQNCPVGLRALKRRAVWLAQVMLGMLLGLLADFGLSSLIPSPIAKWWPQPVSTTGVLVRPEETVIPILPEETKESAPKKGVSLKRRRTM